MNGFLSDLLEVSLTMGAAIALLLILAPVLAKRFSPRWRYWAWLFVTLRLVLPFNLSMPKAPVQVEAPARLTAPQYDPDMTAEVEAARPYGWQAGCVGGTTYEVWYHNDQNDVLHIYDTPIFRLEGVNGEWAFSIHWEGLWALGAAVSLLHLAWSYARLCRDMKKRRLAPSEEELRELEKQRRLLMVLPDAALYRVPGLGSPMLMGFFRPAVLLPENLPGEALPVTLAHELTHLKRHDLWYKLLLALARSLHWFNPLVWLMCRRAGRDVELCCDYDLLCRRDESARRAYGQAILDQMTAGAAPSSRLTTGFSGDKKEVFARFRAIMDTSAKKKGRAALALTLAAVLLAGSLVACQETWENQPRGGGEVTAWLNDSPNLSISAGYYEDGFDWDYDALHALSTLADSCTLVIQLPEGVAGTVRAARDFYHRIPLGDDYGKTVDKDEYELTPDDQGQVSLYLERDPNRGNQQATYFLTWGENSRFRYVFRVNLCDISEEMDFTGYTGRVYAVGAGGISHASDTSFLNLDPCDLTGEDHDHTRYNLPLAEETEISPDLKPFLTGLSSGRYPEFYELELMGGEVVRLTGIWGEESAVISLGYAGLLDHYTGILGIQNREELSSYQPGDDFLMKGDTKLLLAEDADIPDKVLPLLTGQSQDPDLLQYALVMEDGVVTTVLGIWKDITAKGDLPGYTGTLYGAELRGPIEFNGKDYLVLDGYRIPLEEACSTELKEQLSSLSDTGIPGLYEATVADGEITAVEEIWTYQTLPGNLK